MERTFIAAYYAGFGGTVNCEEGEACFHERFVFLPDGSYLTSTPISRTTETLIQASTVSGCSANGRESLEPKALPSSSRLSPTAGMPPTHLIVVSAATG